MTSWLCSSNQTKQINHPNLTSKIETLDSTTSDLITKAIVIQCECEFNFDSAGECVCDTFPLDQSKCIGQVKCLDFAKITKELTGGIITNESLREMYDYISYMLGDEDIFDFPSEWNFSNDNRYILLKNSLNENYQGNNIRGFCFYADELTYIKPLIMIYLCEKKPKIVFS